MESIINRIYELLYLPITTPYNLLDNAKLENYSYVKYYKHEEWFISEMECLCPDKKLHKFFYHFDLNDSLHHVVMETQGEMDIVFDRKTELNKSINEYKKMKKENIINEAV